MKALVFDGALKFNADYPKPERPPGESVIAVSLAGICATDIEIVKGYMGFRGVLGHEFVGRVEESDRKELVGKRVVGEINCACRKCPICRRGLTKHCPGRSVLGIQKRDGAFAQYLTLPDANLHAVPECVTDREAVFVEPLAAACQALDQARPRDGERVLIMGDGRLGLLIAKVFAASGVKSVLVGKYRNKLAIAAADGIETALIDELERARDADVVVDATGDARGLEYALEFVRPAGRIIIKTTTAESSGMPLARIVVDELSLIGSRCGPFGRALQLLADKKVAVQSMISAEYPFERAAEAFKKAQAADMLKVLLAIS